MRRSTFGSLRAAGRSTNLNVQTDVPELFVDAWDELRLRCLVVILQRDEEAFSPRSGQSVTIRINGIQSAA